MIEAILSNPGHPEYGVATIPFPIPREQYDHCVALLEALEIGDVSASDCYVDELQSKWPVLDRLLHTRINLDELDYLAKRLDSFDHEEFLQFHAMADKLELTSMKDLINLTFCCQQATVIQDFCNLEAVGRSHYLNTHGGCADIEELKNLDGEETALLLIEGGEGTVTRYGVVYDNGMKLEPLYDGKQFPAYHYEADSILVGLSSRQEPEDTANITWLCLPASRCQIERAARRSGIMDWNDVRIQIEENAFPAEVHAVLDLPNEDIFDLNELTLAVNRLSEFNRRKLGAVIHATAPESAGQICLLVDQLGLFSFAPGAQTPEEYGKYRIRESGRFAYDPELEDFYDYEKNGRQHMAQENGVFTDLGYLAYHGSLGLEELMMGGDLEEAREPDQQMGGLS